jgi:HlyD family secretion protein
MLQSEHDQVWLQQQQTNLEIEQLQLQKQSIEQQIAELEVKSEMDGKVVSVNDVAGASSNQLEPQPLIQIGTLEQLMVEGIISEYDTLKVEQGQVVVLTSDALPGESWKGKVSFVAFLPEDTNSLGGTGVQYPIKVTVEDKNINLKPGFQMVMEILTEERKAQTLPLTAVKQEGDTNYVFTVVDGKTQKKDVSVGLVSNESIEITDGLSEEDEVLLDPSDDVSAGMDVTVK